MRITYLSALFILIISWTALAHRGTTEEHRRKSDPGRIARALEESRALEGPPTPQEYSLCREVYTCLQNKQPSLGNFVQGAALVTGMLSRLNNDPGVRGNQTILNEMLAQCQNLPTSQAISDMVTRIDNTHWNHGSPNCSTNTDPVIQTERMGMGLTIMRQNKCNTAEAPFIYLLESEDKVFIVDTGDISPGTELYNSVKAIAGDREIVVSHSHNHGDHTAGDSAFRGKPNVTFIDADKNNAMPSYGITNYPNQLGEFDMGDRKLQVIPVPGHEGSSFAFYDPKSKVMLTGDIMYPGRLYINDYPEFTLSLNRMKQFAQNNEVAAFLGGHVEMSTTPGQDIPFGNYAPNERSLVLRNSDLNELYDAAIKNSSNPRTVSLDAFKIMP